MLVKLMNTPILQLKDTAAFSFPLLEKSPLPFLPVVDEEGHYQGVFDKTSLIKLLQNDLLRQESVEKVINTQFPVVSANDISKLFSSNSSGHTIVLDQHNRIAGYLNPFEVKDVFSLLAVPFFDRLLESISDGILICDSDLIVKKVNKAYSRLTGVSAQEIEGRVVTDVRKGAQIPKSVHSGQIMKNIYRKEGDREYFVDLYPIRVEDEVIGGVVLMKDITEVQSLTKTVTEWESKFSKLRRNISDHHRATSTFDSIIATNRLMKEAVEMAKKVACNDSAIIIRGESGSGKEVFAQAIHNYSYRKDDPFVAVNCAAIEPNLILSELFGYEDGTFTGALKGGKMGLFEIAHKGTLFLDEIGDLDFELQSKLLRVLETGEITRVGGQKNIKVDVRIISATHVNLEEHVELKKFRSDLYFRLNVIPIHLPPLRQRREDIEPLIESIMSRLGRELKKTIQITPEVMDALFRYEWPGNIRELQNVLTFAANMQNEGLITLEHIPQKMLTDQTNHHSAAAIPPAFPQAAAHSQPPGKDEGLWNLPNPTDRNQIIRALQQYGTSVEGKKKAAASLKISVATLYNRMNQYGLKGIRF